MPTSTPRLVVLDDDPTGIQTVHDCLATVRWTREALQTCLRDRVPFFYVLTNTRSKSAAEARRTIREVVRAVESEARSLGETCTYLVRSDSTLRGHFPLELSTVIEELDLMPDARFFIPAFFEAGRFTQGDTHWITTPNGPISCGDSEFARDSVFGYGSGHLPTYIEEKTGSPAPDVIRLNAAGDLGLLDSLTGNPWCIVNCRSYEELDRFSAAVHAAMAQGRRFVFQTSSSFPKSYTRTQDSPWSPTASGPGPGLVVVGSHVDLTTRQLKRLLADAPEASGIELSVTELLGAPSHTAASIGRRIAELAERGTTPVVYTSREELRLDGGNNRLAAGERIADTLCDIVADLPYRPSFILSKGGITSHSLLERGLQVDVARSLGQAAPGVPALELPRGHRWEGTPYIVFPGNVGSEDTLAEVYQRLAGSRKENP